MADAPEPNAERLAAYRKAVDRLPVLTRVIFLLVRLDDLSYGDIARRLSIDAQAVASCLVEALGMIRMMLDGEPPRRRTDPRIVLAARLTCIGAIAPIARKLCGHCVSPVRSRGPGMAATTRPSCA